MTRSRMQIWFAAVALVALSIGSAPANANEEGSSSVKVRYLEIVSNDVDAQCSVLEQVHGVSFGPEVAELGNARVAEGEGGTLIGVRAPMAAHEQPITRTYLVVDDIAKAVKAAEAAGAMIAYPPTRQGESGTWAIYIVGDTQFGLWQP